MRLTLLVSARRPTRPDDGGQIVNQVVKWSLGSEVTELVRLPALATSLALSPDGRYLASASPAGMHVSLLHTTATGSAATFSAAEVQALACSQAEQPQLSAADWQKYFGAEPLRYTCGEAIAAAPASPSIRR